MAHMLPTSYKGTAYLQTTELLVQFILETTLVYSQWRYRQQMFAGNPGKGVFEVQVKPLGFVYNP